MQKCRKTELSFSSKPFCYIQYSFDFFRMFCCFLLLFSNICHFSLFHFLSNMSVGTSENYEKKLYRFLTFSVYIFKIQNVLKNNLYSYVFNNTKNSHFKKYDFPARFSQQVIALKIYFLNINLIFSQEPETSSLPEYCS